MTSEQNVTAFVNVSVVPMDREILLHDQTVVVEAGTITYVGPSSGTTITENARVVEGRDSYLMPGLCDMHAHLAFRDTDPGHLVLYLAEGTTTVRSLSGDPMNASWRDRIAAGDLLGPTIHTSGPTMVGPLEGEIPDVLPALPIVSIRSASEAEDEVRRQAEGWSDLVKVYDGLAPEAYLAAIRAARNAGMYVAGHALDELSLEEIVEAGINEIAHLDELNFRHWIGEPGEPGFALDYAAIPATADLLARNDVAVVSNLSADEVMADLIFDTEAVLARPEYRVVPPEMLEFWRTAGRQLTSFADQGPYRRDLEMPFFKALVADLHRAGVTVLTGTDTAFLMEGTVPGQIHREIELLREAGLSNFQALAAASSSAAEVVARMGRDGRFGTVVPGNRADLVLLDGNPLDDVSETRRRVGVMGRGRFYPQGELDEMVDGFVAGYGSRVAT